MLDGLGHDLLDQVAEDVESHVSLRLLLLRFLRRHILEHGGCFLRDLVLLLLDHPAQLPVLVYDGLLQVVDGLLLLLWSQLRGIPDNHLELDVEQLLPLHHHLLEGLCHVLHVLHLLL